MCLDLLVVLLGAGLPGLPPRKASGNFHEQVRQRAERPSSSATVAAVVPDRACVPQAEHERGSRPRQRSRSDLRKHQRGHELHCLSVLRPEGVEAVTQARAARRSRSFRPRRAGPARLNISGPLTAPPRWRRLGPRRSSGSRSASWSKPGPNPRRRAPPDHALADRAPGGRPGARLPGAEPGGRGRRGRGLLRDSAGADHRACQQAR